MSPEIYNANQVKDEPSSPPTLSQSDSPSQKHRRPKSTEYSQVMRDYHPTRNPLAAFMVRPPHVRVGIQEETETILLLLRRHFITNTPWILVVVFMAIAPLIISQLPFGINLLPLRFSTALGILWYLLTIAVGLEGFLSWFYNVFIITDERIIDVDFLNIIYKNVSTAKIDNIEDVTAEMGGALRSVLNFGNVFVQTAAEKTQFEFEDVPNPQQVAKFLNEMMLQEEREKLEGRVS